MISARMSERSVWVAPLAPHCVQNMYKEFWEEQHLQAGRQEDSEGLLKQMSQG
jgi:hypothetical protein